ncbi:substrate-binding domain-containing protein [Acidisphaera sp. L21]|uniref:substrate-binding domain-containing protein n=1 Tax=Acidisphaera sp. L21 TaxID=1641851 RepID=UPI00131B755B|nr:substrate-binding domain-containing protein [Acidisphaera sp. L21]
MTEPSPLRIFAAGSLRAALTALLAQHGEQPDIVFGPAGLLRERIEAGDVPDLYLSANLEHPAAIATRHPGALVQPFAGNRLVALARRDLGLTTENFLDRLMLDRVRIGTSTPVVDPSGDYAYRLFDRAEAVRPGAKASLVAHTRALVGGRDGGPHGMGPFPVKAFLERGDVDVFISYASSAAAIGDGLDVVLPPENLAVTATYGLIVLAPGARALAALIGSAEGQAVLGRFGFLPAS